MASPCPTETQVYPGTRALIELHPLPELRPMSLDFPPLKPIVPKMSVLVKEINSTDSYTPAAESRHTSNSCELDPSEETFTAVSLVYQHNPVHACSFGPY